MARKSDDDEDEDEEADADLLGDLLGVTDFDSDDIIEIGERTLVYVEHIRDADEQLEFELEQWDDEEKYEG
jgi:hypothetical protein